MDKKNIDRFITLEEIREAFKKCGDDRHVILEAALIIEESMYAIIELYLPDLRKKTKRLHLTLDQVIELFKYFLDDGNDTLAKFPTQLQSMRNNVAHKRNYVIGNEQLKEFYKKLGKNEKNVIDKVFDKLKNSLGGKPNSFKNLQPRDQLELLVIWFTQFVNVEVDRGEFSFMRLSI